MLWRRYWRGRRARPSASLGGQTDASACYLAAAANGCAAAAGSKRHGDPEGRDAAALIAWFNNGNAGPYLR